MHKILFYTLNLCFFSALAAAQEVTVQANCNKKAITIGEHFEYTIKVSATSQNKIIFPILPDTFNKFEIIEKSKPKEYEESNRTIYEQKYIVTNYDSGLWTIPAFTIKYNSSTDVNTKDAYTDTVVIKVNTLKVSLKEPIKDILGPDDEGFTFKKLFKYIFLFMIGIVLLYLIWKYVQRLKNKKEELWKKALRVLKQEQTNKTWLKDPKAFSSKVGDTLREYLQGHLKIEAIDKPSSDLLEACKNNELTKAHHTVLTEIFSSTDLIKFAKANLPQETLQAVAANALLFVEKTYPLMLQQNTKQHAH